MHTLTFSLFLSLSTLSAQAASNESSRLPEPKAIEYKDAFQDQEVILEGFYAKPKSGGKHPGILVVHEWTGIGPYVKMRIQKLADLGYVAFAADIYGKGIRPTSPEEAGKIANIYKTDRKLMRKRAQLALDQLKKIPGVDPSKIAVIGYCFGGTTALELARSGADLRGTVSFHGGLNTPTPNDARQIKGEVLILHGADDPYVPAKEVDAFEKEMRDGKVKWQLTKYGGAVHSFTNPDAGSDNSKGAAYNADADLKSWEEMKTFFKRIFAQN